MVFLPQAFSIRLIAEPTFFGGAPTQVPEAVQGHCHFLVIDQIEKFGWRLNTWLRLEEAAMRQGALGGAGGPKGEGGGVFPESDPSASIFTAVQQLGLKMEPRKRRRSF